MSGEMKAERHALSAAREQRMMLIRSYAGMFNDNSIEKGFVVPGQPRSMDRIVALLHTEISEAYEEFRMGTPPLYVVRDGAMVLPMKDAVVDDVMEAWEWRKPEGVAAEFADLFIRLLQSAEELGINLAQAVEAKHLYNRTRPFMHGGKRA